MPLEQKKPQQWGFRALEYTPHTTRVRMRLSLALHGEQNHLA